MKIMEIKNLSLKTKDRYIIENISFDVNLGEKICIIGKSGSGKTQLLKSILKISKLEKEGIILIDNKENYILGKDVGAIFQDFSLSLNPVLTIKQQMIEGPIYHKLLNKKQAINKAKKLLNELNLSEEILNRYPFELSGGQKQRVIIAIVLMLDPKLIICDEITTGLDPINEYEVVNLLKNMNKSIVMITHSFNVIKHFADEIVFLEEGHLKFKGKFKELLKIKDSKYIESMLKVGNYEL